MMYWGIVLERGYTFLRIACE